MIYHLIRFSIQNKLVIAILVISLFLVGLYETKNLPIDAMPDITNNQVLVISTVPPYSALDIERLVTMPIEQANSNIPGLKEVRSFSRFGLSLVTLVFEDEVDIYWARQQVNERLQKMNIPKDLCVPELGPISTGLGEIYQYVLRVKKEYQKKYSLRTLRTLQDWVVRKELLRVKGVAEVNSLGGEVKQYAIEIKPSFLKSNQTSLSEVVNAIEQNNQNIGGAYIEKREQALFIMTEGLLKNIDDIKNIAIRFQANGMPLLVKDVAEVTESSGIRYGAMCYNDEGETCGGIVMMLKGENSNQIVKNVKDKVTEIQKMLPEGVYIEAFLDRTKMVNNAIQTVVINLLEGCLIVFFLLVVFFGNWRISFLVASVIPLSLLFAIILMNLFGISGNLMSLGALDFGLIIDGAIIIVEATIHIVGKQMGFNKQIQFSTKEANEIVLESSNKMMNSAIFGQLIILIVYLPILTLEGIEGKMFRPMVQTISFTLMGAFILSLTYVPMMSAWLWQRKFVLKKPWSEKIIEWLKSRHEKILAQVFKYPKSILTCVFIVFFCSLFVFSKLGGEFIPVIEEGDLAMDTRILTGSNINATIDYTQKASTLLLKNFPEIEKIVTKIGSGEVPTDPMPMEASDMMIILKDKKEWTSAKSFTELSQKFNHQLDNILGINIGFQFPVQMRFNELMTGSKQDVSCKIFGENLDSLAHYASQLGEIIKQIKGAEDLYIEAIGGMPQIKIQYNRPLLTQYQINIKEVNDLIFTAFAGKEVGKIYEGEKIFNMVVRLNKPKQKSLEDIKNLLVPSKKDNHINLSQIADISLFDGPNQIQREQTKRRIIVGFNVRGRDVESIVLELKKIVNAKLKVSPDYSIQYGGTFENLNVAKKRLWVAVPIALLLIFILLYFAFKNLTDSILIYSAIPLSLIGGILFLSIREMPFSISAGVGFIALFGIAVLNGIVLISEFHSLKKQNHSIFLEDLIKQGTKRRLKPILMTLLVATFGFVPMAVSTGAGAEVQKPLATVVIGGLLIATLLTLFVLPLLYLLVYKKK